MQRHAELFSLFGAFGPRAGRLGTFARPEHQASIIAMIAISDHNFYQW